tara:strand:- start:5373 stop:5657 length:285 start_codon:yes stop_codon:yes gene_type:complete
MLSKQSIRRNVRITLDNVVLNKEEVLLFSTEWNEREELLFRKMLKQGGSIKIQNKVFKVELEENTTLNSRGNFDAPIKPMDYSGDNVDPNYTRK